MSAVGAMNQMSEAILPNCILHHLPIKGDERGSLIAIEAGSTLPFQIARTYYIFGTRPGVGRGCHAHRNLQQWAICVSGACTIIVDNGAERKSVRLDRPDRALEIGSRIWREMHDFTSDAVLLVLASMPFDEADYIRNYEGFLEFVRNG